MRWLPLLLLAGCTTVELPVWDGTTWANIPDPGSYTLSIESEELDECDLAGPFVEFPAWQLTARNSARDAFNLEQFESGRFVQCGFADPGYACWESDIGTWLTGFVDVAVWMDGEDRSDGFAITLDALQTCADEGGGCADPCESRFVIHAAGPNG
jgi:hypothetical protein